MYIKNLAPDFDSVDDFFNTFGMANKENVSLSVPCKNELILKNNRNDNSLNVTLFRNKKVLEAGKTYTISCDFVLNKKITKSLPFDVPKIAFDGMIGNECKYDIHSSLSIPNEVGVWHKNLTITVPNNFSHAWFRLHAGIEKDAGEILIKNIFVSETNFEFKFNNELFIQEGKSFILKEVTDKNLIYLYKELNDFGQKKDYNYISTLIENIDNQSVKKKAKIYLHLLKEDIKSVSEEIDHLLPELTENDELLIVSILKFFAKKTDWVRSKNLIDSIDSRNLFLNSSDILFEKAQLYRRLGIVEKEKNNYSQALSMIYQKNNINWELFFDNHNPGLSYRLDELRFINRNLDKIQKIADYYNPIDINFKESPVFVFWDQGYDKAPPIVKVMIDRMKSVYKDRLVLLTSENLEAYLDLSSGIQKFRETRRAFFSDYIRTELLLKYGGTWIDSTVFITERFNNEVLSILDDKKSNFYVLRIPKNPYRISSWFEATNQKNNRIVSLMYGALLVFAEEYDDIFEYYQYHTFFEILTQLDEKANKEFEQNYRDKYQPYGHDVLKNFREDWDEKLFYSLLERCPIQKLTYRSNLLHLRTQSFYKNILRNGLNL